MLPLIWMKFCMLTQPVGLLELLLNLFCTDDIQGRELDWRDFIKHTINIALSWDSCEPICFKFEMMLDTTSLYSLIMGRRVV